MRRVVTASLIVLIASALVACSSPAPTTTTNVPATGTPATSGAKATTGAKTGGAVGDIYSPTQTVTPGEVLSKDEAIVPATVLAKVAAGRPMLIFWLDPTTKVEADQLKEITAAMRKYSTSIDLVSFDYTVGLGSATSTPTADPEIRKVNEFAASLKINTTPYIVLVDRYGRITYRFAGIVDSGLLTREILRAIQ